MKSGEYGELPQGRDERGREQIGGEESELEQLKRLVDEYVARIKGVKNDFELKLIVSEILMSALDEKERQKQNRQEE